MMQQSDTFDNKIVFILKNKHYAKSYATFKMMLSRYNRVTKLPVKAQIYDNRNHKPVKDI